MSTTIEISNVAIYSKANGSTSGWDTNSNNTNYVGLGSAVAFGFSTTSFTSLNISQINNVICTINYIRASSSAIPINLYSGPKNINTDGPGINSSSECILHSSNELKTKTSGTSLTMSTTLSKTQSQSLIEVLKNGGAIYLYAPNGPSGSVANIQSITLSITYSTINAYVHNGTNWLPANKIYVHNGTGWQIASELYVKNSSSWQQSG